MDRPDPRRHALLAQLRQANDFPLESHGRLNAAVQAGAEADRLMSACREVQAAHLVAGDLMREAMLLSVQTGARLPGMHARRRRAA